MTLTRILAATLGLAFLAGCGADVYAEVARTRMGQKVPDYDTALQQSGADDLGCSIESVRVSKVQINVSRATSSVDVADGCGRRAVYGNRCDMDVQHDDATNTTTYTRTCQPSLIGRIGT